MEEGCDVGGPAGPSPAVGQVRAEEEQCEPDKAGRHGGWGARLPW